MIRKRGEVNEEMETDMKEERVPEMKEYRVT